MGMAKGLLRLIRPELPVSAGVCTVLGQLFALGGLPGAGQATAAFGAIFLTSGAILVLNDYFDVETDRVNAPHRPIPSGQMSPGAALAFFCALTAGGLALAACTGPATLCAAVLLGWFAPVYLLPIAVIDGSILFFGLRLLRSSGQEGRAHIRGIYLGATAGLVIFLLMRLAGV